MSEFNRPTIEEIYQRIKADMESRVSSDVKIPRFSLLGILAIVFAGAMHLLYGYLVWLADQLFIDTASTWFLDRIANLYNLPRKPATYTVGIIRLFGTSGYTIVAGTVIVNSEGITYTTDRSVTLLGGQVDAVVTADVGSPGTVGNSSDTTMNLQSPDADVQTEVTVISGFDNGVDQETNDELRDRLRQRLQNPPSSGTCADYVRWLLEVPGVGKAWCFDAESNDPSSPTSIQVGAGNVVLVIAQSNLDVVSSVVKAAAELYILTVRPAGASFDLYDAEPSQTTLFISIAPRTSEIEAAINEKVSELYIAETEPSGTVLLSHMNSAVASAGVTDYEITRIDYKGVPTFPPTNLDTPGLEVAQPTDGIYSSI